MLRERVVSIEVAAYLVGTGLEAVRQAIRKRKVLLFWHRRHSKTVTAPGPGSWILVSREQPNGPITIGSFQRNTKAHDPHINNGIYAGGPLGRCNGWCYSDRKRTIGGTMTGTLLTLREVQARLKISRTSIYRRMREGKFPLPVKITEKAVRWKEEEIEEYIAGRERSNGWSGK